MNTSEFSTSSRPGFMYKEIENPYLLEYAKNQLPLHGSLQCVDPDAYCYLKIHDDFIFKLFPLLKEDNICMPDYFSPQKKTGAHISIVYPNEPYADEIKKNIRLRKPEQLIYFEIKELIEVRTVDKTFIALTVSCPQLEQLRTQYGLSTKLNYNGLIVPFHITIAREISIIKPRD